jgi:aspartyl-tRNA(Asn)/glutamyl-tRNA(Gln) amidotransferase subunit B
VKEKGLVQISDEGELQKIADEILSAHPAEVAQYQSGKTKLLGFFVGQVMKATGGKASPPLVNQILKNKLGGS